VGYILDTIIDQGITVLQMVPSVLRLLVDDRRFVRCTNLRRLLCGGEIMTIDLALQVLNALELQLINLYGPSEACIDSTSYLVEQGIRAQIVPIGKPIANVKTYILDAKRRPLPVGIAGELHISGISVGRGYLNRPQLTAERFLQDPFTLLDKAGNDAGMMMYATGDLTRYLPDGNIEFLGRMDNQVKIHGVRIELAEIERVIERHKDVRQAIVLVKENRGDMILVAYVQLCPDCILQVEDLRSYLYGHLPPYMIPPVIVFVDSLPLSSSGKIDPGALPQVGELLLKGQEKYTAPRTALERALADIIAHILKVDQVGLRDNFFALGGHSLVAMRLISQVNDLFKVDLSLQQFFNAPTVEGLVGALIAAEKLSQLSGASDQLERRAELLLKVAEMTDEEAQRLLDERQRSSF
jgi:acyl-coenzyme A synthetase/AMP-(fatty) acid ligase/acyl carrier protein